MYWMWSHHFPQTLKVILQRLFPRSVRSLLVWSHTFRKLLEVAAYYLELRAETM
jgi:hypothetical protein